MLNVKIVSASVRIGGWAMSQRIPSAISARRLRRSADRSRVPIATRETSTAPSAKQAAFVANGRAMPTANRNAPIGGKSSWFVKRNAPCIRAFAMPRSSRLTRLGINVLLAESANVSAVPRMNRTMSTTAMLTVAGHDHEHEPAEDDRPADVHDHDHPPALEPVRGGTAEDAEQQDRQVLAQERHRDEERVARLRRDEERPGRDDDTVAGVVDERGGQEPAEARPEPGWRDRLGQAGGDESHAGEGTNAPRRATREPRTAIRPRPMPRSRVAYRRPTAVVPSVVIRATVTFWRLGFPCTRTDSKVEPLRISMSPIVLATMKT